MTTHRTIENTLKSQVYEWASYMGCPDEKLGLVWSNFIGKSLALDEKSAIIQVAQIVSGIGVNIDVHRFRNLISEV